MTDVGFEAQDLPVVLVEKNSALTYGWIWSLKQLDLFHTLHYGQPFVFLSIIAYFSRWLFCHATDISQSPEYKWLIYRGYAV